MSSTITKHEPRLFEKASRAAMLAKALRNFHIFVLICLRSPFFCVLHKNSHSPLICILQTSLQRKMHLSSSWLLPFPFQSASAENIMMMMIGLAWMARRSDQRNLPHARRRSSHGEKCVFMCSEFRNEIKILKPD